MTTRGDHTLNVRMLRFRGKAEREEPAMLTLDLCSKSRPRDAIDVATAALRRTPGDPDVLMALGRALYEDGQHDRAQEALIAAANSDRTWAEPYVWLFRVLAACGRAEKATQLAARAISLGAKEPDLTAYVRDRALAARFSRWRADRRSEEPSLLALGLLEASWHEEAREVVELELAADPADEDLRSLAVRTGVAVPLLARAERNVVAPPTARDVPHDTLVDCAAPTWMQTPPAVPRRQTPRVSQSKQLQQFLATRLARVGTLRATAI